MFLLTKLWHDQGKWVTCRKCQFLFSYTTFSKLQNASFWCKPHHNWVSGYRVMKDLTMLKTIWNKGIWTLFLPISQKQHPRHPTHSSWSCHILLTCKHIIFFVRCRCSFILGDNTWSKVMNLSILFVLDLVLDPELQHVIYRFENTIFYFVQVLWPCFVDPSGSDVNYHEYSHSRPDYWW